MTGDRTARTDPFGDAVGLRLLRRCAGGTVTVAAAVLIFVSQEVNDPFSVGMYFVVAGVLCTALSWPLELLRPARWPVLRYAGLGALAGMTAVFFLPGGQDFWWFAALMFGAPIGGAGGVLGATTARYAPREILAPLSTSGAVIIAWIMASAWSRGGG